MTRMSFDVAAGLGAPFPECKKGPGRWSARCWAGWGRGRRPGGSARRWRAGPGAHGRWGGLSGGPRAPEPVGVWLGAGGARSPNLIIFAGCRPRRAVASCAVLEQKRRAQLLGWNWLLGTDKNNAVSIRYLCNG